MPPFLKSQYFNYSTTVLFAYLALCQIIDFLLSKKMLNTVKCIQPTPHTTSNYIRTEEECVAISF